MHLKNLKSFEGSLLILISALMFGSYGVFSRYLSQYDVFFQTYLRCFVVAAILITIGLVRKEYRKVKREDIGWFITVLIFTSFSIAPIVYAYRYIEIGTASFLFYASFTVCTYILGFIFFKEKFNAVKIISLILSIAGLLFIFSINLGTLLIIPVLMAILNGLGSSGEVTFSKKLSGKYTSNQITMMIFVSIGISHLIISLLIGERQNFEIITNSGFILLSFAFAAIIGMLTVIEGFKYVDPSIGALIGLMEIVFTVLFGIILFNEILSLNIIIGGILITLAAALPSIKDYIEEKRLKPSGS